MDTMLHGFDFELWAADTNTGRFSGRAAVFGEIPYAPFAPPGGVELMQGAFTKTISERNKPWPILRNHDPDIVIGAAPRIWEDMIALNFEGQLTMEVQAAREELALMKSGAITEMSIGFDIIKRRVDDELERLYIEEVHLFEISPTPMAANPNAEIIEVHSRCLIDEAWGALPFHSLPLAASDAPWNGARARSNLIRWAGGPENMDWAKFARAFLWVDPSRRENIAAYRFPIADVSRGRLRAVPGGISAAAAAVAEAGKIPSADLGRLSAHIVRYYKMMDTEPPVCLGTLETLDAGAPPPAEPPDSVGTRIEGPCRDSRALALVVGIQADLMRTKTLLGGSISGRQKN